MTGTSRRFASAKAAADQGHQSTGLSAWERRYGLMADARRAATSPAYAAPGAPSGADSPTLARMTTTHVSYVGGPTALVEYGGLRILLDPTFDEPRHYPKHDLTKTAGPGLTTAELGPVDV